MNTNKKILFFALFSIFLVGSIFFLTAQETIPDPITPDYTIENIKDFKTQNADVQEDIETGILTISGTNSEYSVVKWADKKGSKNYDLSGEDSYIKIDKATGEIISGKYTISRKDVWGKDLTSGQDVDFGNTKSLKNLPAGTEVSYEEGELLLGFPSDSSKYPGETFSVKGVENINFDLFNRVGSSKQSLEFTTTENGEMSFLGRDISLSPGKVSMKNDYWDVPDASKINNLGSSEKSMIIGGENLLVSKSLIPGLDNDLNYDGYLGSTKGKIYVPYQGSTKPFEVNNKGLSIVTSESYPNTFLDFSGDTFTNTNEKFYLSMYKDSSGTPVFDYNHGSTKGGLEVVFDKTNPYFEMKDDDYFSVNNGDLGGEGSVSIVGTTTGDGEEYLPVVQTTGEVQLNSDGKSMSVLGDKIHISNNFDQGLKDSVPMMVATTLDSGEGVRTAIADKDTFYFKTASGTPKDVIGIDKNIANKFSSKKERILPSKLDPKWFGEGPMRYSLADLKKLNDGEYLNQYVTVNKIEERNEKFRIDNRPSFEQTYLDRFGNEGYTVLSTIRGFYKDHSSDEAERLVLEYQDQLRQQGLLKPNGVFPSFDLRDAKDYDNYLRNANEEKKIIEEWIGKEYISEQDGYNKLGQIEKTLTYYGFRFDNEPKKSFSTTDVYLIKF